MNTRHAHEGLLCIACAWAVFSLVGIDSSVAPAQDEAAEDSYRYDPTDRRDPFLSPFSLQLEPEIPEEAKTPLQRFDLGQLKLVGVIWETSEPKALIEDGGGLGYIVTRGTLIGSKGGVIRAIEPRRIVIEEYETDFYGKRQAQERELLLSIVESAREGAKKKGQ
jgi:type IV pilus assembly protein PilP